MSIRYNMTKDINDDNEVDLEKENSNFRETYQEDKRLLLKDS